jgi:hypothetical protein
MRACSMATHLIAGVLNAVHPILAVTSIVAEIQHALYSIIQ